MNIMKNIDWKHIGVNYMLPIFLLLTISYAYFSPLLDGKTLQAHDTSVSIASKKEIVDFRNKTGQEALWTNSMFSGMPAYQISTVYKGNLVKWINKILLIGQRPASYLFLWFVSFFILMLAFGVHPWLSFAGALAFGFTTNFYMLTAAGHMTKVLSLGYVPLIFAGIVWAFKGKKILGATVVGISLSLMLNANHPQMAYYAGLSVLIFGLVYLGFAIKEKTLIPFFSTVAILLVAVVLAIGTNYARVSTNASYTKQTMRGKSELTPKGGEKSDKTSGLDKSYIWDYSYGIKETFTLMIPNFMGGSSSGLPKDGETAKALKGRVKDVKSALRGFPAYWGPQRFTAGPSYFGAIICFLFVLGLFVIKGKEKWWLLGVTLFSIVLSWGKHVPGIAGFFIDHFPLFNKFRDMSMMLVIAQFSMPVLALLALNEIYKGNIDKKSFMKSLYWSFGLTGGVSLLLALIPSFAGDFYAQHAEIARMEAKYSATNAWLMEAVVKDRQAILKADAFRSFMFIALAGLAIWALVLQKIKKSYFLAAISILVIVDMWPVDKRYLGDDKFVNQSKVRTPYPASAADKAILRDKDPDYRVLSLAVSPFNDASVSMHHKSIGGYHGAKLQRYQDMIEHYIMPEIQTIGKNLKGAKSMADIFGNTKVLNMLNTKYVIYNPNSGPLPNSLAFGNAWPVNEIKFVPNPDAEIAGLGSIDPRHQAVVDVRFKDVIGDFVGDSAAKASIKLTSYAPNKLTYKFAGKKNEAVLFSEVYYADGWNAYIDGKEVDHFRANYILRGLMVPAGTHNIEFRFEPKAYFQGNTIALISSLLLLLSLAYVLVMEVRQQKK